MPLVNFKSYICQNKWLWCSKQALPRLSEIYALHAWFNCCKNCFSLLPQGSFFSCLLCVPGTRFDDGAGGDNEVQRTMLELINQLDGFDPRGNIKVLMATNR